MAQVRFWKLHGLGNDFVFLDGMDHEVELTVEQVQALCDRHMGIGGDGVIVVKPSPRPECAGYMHYINSDGTLAQMCGNGVRCFAKFLVDHGYAPVEEGALVADTLSGPKPISFDVDQAGKMTLATVDMGAPVLEPGSVPVDAPSNAVSPDGTSFVKEMELDSPWGSFAFTCVSMGNPHAVCFIDDLEDLPASLFSDPDSRSLASMRIDEVGAFFERHPVFPEKTNVEFAIVHDEAHLSMRVFERGCGETLACGTGTCATVVAACLTGRASAEADVDLLGGTLHINYTGETVLMTGPAQMSFEGTVDIS